MTTQLVLSEIAGRVGVTVSTGDTVDQLAEAIVGAVQQARPLELSETEKKLSFSFRDAKLDKLRDAGVPPVIVTRLATRYQDLSLSNDECEEIVDLVLDMWTARVKQVNEKSAAQVAEAPPTPNEAWTARTKSLKPIA